MSASAIRLLRRAIKASGLSNRKYAEQVLTRDERTIRRWLSGQTAVPRAVIAKLTVESAASARLTRAGARGDA